MYNSQMDTETTNIKSKSLFHTFLEIFLQEKKNLRCMGIFMFKDVQHYAMYKNTRAETIQMPSKR